MTARRAAGWIFFTVGIVLALLGGWRWSHKHPTAAPPLLRSAKNADVLLITLDTTRADHLGCYGGDPEATPNLDRLARRGALFENAIATAPITLPSHTSMLTGLYAIHHGIRNNGMFSLTEGTQTLAEVLHGRGYATGAFVSAAVLADRYGLDRGFDVYDDDLSQGRSSGRHSVPERRGDLTVAAALDWLQQVPEGRPFFCWLHLYDPHSPYDPPPDTRRRFPGDPYTGEISFADALVGKVLDRLEGLGRLSRTLVSVIADHGEGLGEHGEQTHAILLYGATMHVPWVLAGPHIPAGLRVETPVSGADVAPTLAALVAAPPPNRHDLDGLSAVPLLTGGGGSRQQRTLYSETLLPRYQYGWQPLYAVRRGQWELVSGRRRELFDIDHDPRELTDVAGAEQAVTEALVADLEEYVGSEAESPTAGARLELSRSEVDQLQALGYLGADAVPRPDPPDPRDLIGAHVAMERARSLSSRGHAEEAIAALDSMLAEDPGNVSAITLRAQLTFQLGRFDEAQQTIERCLAVDPDNATAYATMARLELARKHPQRALQAARAGSHARGAFETLNVLQAEALSALGRRDEAIALLEQRLEEHPNDADLLAARARQALTRGDQDDAERLLRRAVAADALHGESSLTLATLLEDTGRSAEAAQVLEDLLRIDPGNPGALAALGRVRLADPERARPYLEEAVRLNPSRFEPLVSLGICYLKLELTDKAEAALRRALALHPDDVRCRNNLAIALLLERRLGDAERELRDILAAAPRFAEAHNNLALVLREQGRTRQAEESAREALRLSPRLRDASLTLATILHDGKRYEEEMAVLAPLYEAEPDNGELAARYGLAAAGGGLWGRAEPLLEQAQSVFPNHPEVLMATARCAEAQGQGPRAIKLYERVAQVAAEGPLRSEALAAVERLARSVQE